MPIFLNFKGLQGPCEGVKIMMLIEGKQQLTSSLPTAHGQDVIQAFTKHLIQSLNKHLSRIHTTPGIQKTSIIQSLNKHLSRTYNTPGIQQTSIIQSLNKHLLRPYATPYIGLRLRSINRSPQAESSHCLFLYSLQTKNGFCIFMKLQKKNPNISRHAEII